MYMYVYIHIYIYIYIYGFQTVFRVQGSGISLFWSDPPFRIPSFGGRCIRTFPSRVWTNLGQVGGPWAF